MLTDQELINTQDSDCPCFTMQGPEGLVWRCSRKAVTRIIGCCQQYRLCMGHWLIHNLVFYRENYRSKYRQYSC